MRHSWKALLPSCLCKIYCPKKSHSVPRGCLYPPRTDKELLIFTMEGRSTSISGSNPLAPPSTVAEREGKGERRFFHLAPSFLPSLPSFLPVPLRPFGVPSKSGESHHDRVRQWRAAAPAAGRGICRTSAEIPVYLLCASRRWRRHEDVSMGHWGVRVGWGVHGCVHCGLGSLCGGAVAVEGVEGGRRENSYTCCPRRICLLCCATRPLALCNGRDFFAGHAGDQSPNLAPRVVLHPVDVYKQKG